MRENKARMEYQALLLAGGQEGSNPSTHTFRAIVPIWEHTEFCKLLMPVK